MIDGQFTQKILQYLATGAKTLNEALLEDAGERCKTAFKRQLMEERSEAKGKLRMSGGGHCARKQWYSFKGEVGEPLSPRTINTFLMGDICEVGISTLARLAGWEFQSKGSEQIEVFQQVPVPTDRQEPAQEPYLVTGHIDDLLIVDGKKYLVEYKSASEYSYRSFENEGLSESFGYHSQHSLYLDALGLDEGIMVYMCKNTGHLCDRVIKKDMGLVAQAKENWRKILNDPSIPERKFEAVPETYRKKPTGRIVLPFNCSYCQHVKRCWPGAQLEKHGGKPVYVAGQAGQAVAA